jgi:hypothetical protein
MNQQKCPALADKFGMDDNEAFSDFDSRPIGWLVRA